MFYEHLKKICEERGEKMTPLLKKIGIATSATGRWQTGVIPNGESLIKLADYFGVSVDYILGRKEISTSVTASSVSGIAFLQSLDNGIATTGESKLQGLSREEIELLQIFNGLDFRGRLQILNLAADLHDASTQGELKHSSPESTEQS